MRFVLQSLDVDGFVINGMFESNDTAELLDLARVSGGSVRIWDRMKQQEFDRGVCGGCEEQPCQCAHRKAPGWLAALEQEIAEMPITLKEAA